VRDGDLKPGNESLAGELYEAGHHTTIQHAHFLFILDRVSRQFLWSFLHAHPFYNSEQVSQRYVTVKPGEFYYRPALTEETAPLYDDCCNRQLAEYQKLTELLIPVTKAEYLSRFPGRKNDPAADKEAKKKAQEIGRYLLPVATFAYLYHSVSALTLLRYHRLSNQYDCPDETRAVVAAMVAELLKHDERYKALLHEPIPIEETPEHRHFLASSAANSTRS
jgi:thymidylate synthase ThyX